MKPTVSGAAPGLVAAGVAAAVVVVVSVFSVCLQPPSTASASSALLHASSSERRLGRAPALARQGEEQADANGEGKIAADVGFMIGLADTLLVQRFTSFSTSRRRL